MRLLRVETNRFLSRRLTRVAALGVLAVVALAVFSLWEGSRPVPEADLAMAQAQFELDLEDWEENKDERIADCREQEELTQEVDPSADYGCDDMEPRLEYYTWQPPTFAEEAPGILPILALPIAFAALLVGVGFVAAEFTTGSIGNWLTFEPRRTRVFFSKMGAAAAATLPVAFALLAVTIGAAWLAYSLNGHVGSMTSDVWSEVAASGLRVLLLVVGSAVMGAALGALVRSTAAAIGIVIGYVVVVEGLLGSLVDSLQPYLLRLNLMALAEGEARYSTEDCSVVAGERVCEWVERSVSLTQGAVTLTAILVVLVTIAWLAFRRRDVV